MSRRRATGAGTDNGVVRWPLVVTMFAIVIMAVTLVAGSPFALRLFGGADGEWERLSFIGQTYGAVSALIAVFALVGIVVTLVFQARETQRAVQESRRQAMSQLLEKAMDDPDLDECWGPVPEPGDPKSRKQQLYINMIVSQWGVAYETGAMPERRLRAIAREMFSNRPGRVYWARAREPQLSVVTEGKKGRFNQILDEEYQQARLTTEDQPDAATHRAEDTQGPDPTAVASRTTFLSGVLAGTAMVGVLAAVAAAVVAGVRGARHRTGHRRRCNV